MIRVPVGVAASMLNSTSCLSLDDKEARKKAWVAHGGGGVTSSHAYLSPKLK